MFVIVVMKYSGSKREDELKTAISPKDILADSEGRRHFEVYRPVKRECIRDIFYVYLRIVLQWVSHGVFIMGCAMFGLLRVWYNVNKYQIWMLV